MPVVAVLGAVIAGAVAAPAIGGLIAGTALTIGGALEITAAVGATLGAVGAVTRDKGLQTAGLIIGGIGGIGSLASAAGLIDGAAPLFGEAASGAGSATAGLDALNGAITDSESAAPWASNDIVSSMSGAGLSDADLSALGISRDELNAGMLSPTGAADQSAFAPVSDLAKTTAAAEGNASAIAPNPADALTGQDAANASANYGSGLINSPPSSAAVPDAAKVPSNVDVTASPAGFGGSGMVGDALKGIKDFATSSPLATYGLIQAGGSFVSGMFNPVTPAQVSALNAQAEANRAAASMTKQQVSNMQSGVPSVTSIPRQVQGSVTGTPAPVTGAGLINRNPSAYAVTGAPA